jgi:uncharacterized membrane protein HdeD (DUF308 family)
VSLGRWLLKNRGLYQRHGRSRISNLFNIKEKHMSADAMSFETNQAPWWVTLMGGLLSIVIGLLLLTSPAKTVVTLVIALGFYWIITGIFTLVAMFVDHSAWGWKLFMGLLSIIAGVIILRYPLISVLTIPTFLILMIGIQGLITGIIGLVLAFKGAGWGAGILSAISIFFGLVLILNFTSPALILSLVWVTAVIAVVGGIFEIALAFKQRAA